MAKTFKETAVGKFLSSKGFGKVLEVAGSVVPGVKILNDVKELVLGSDEYKQLSPDQQQHFLDLHRAEMEELDKYLADTKDARNREIEIAKTGKKDIMMFITGCVGLGAFLFMIYSITFLNIPDKNEPLFIHLLGIVEGASLAMFNYYYGSSKGSREKTAILKTK